MCLAMYALKALSHSHMRLQGLFEIAARTYRSRASVAASIDFDSDDSPADDEYMFWQTADGDDLLQPSSTAAGVQHRHGEARLHRLAVCAHTLLPTSEALPTVRMGDRGGV